MCSKLKDEIKRREAVNKTAPFPPYDREVISDLKILDEMKSKINYNSEKIHYCKTCLSIAIKTITIPSSEKENDVEIDYCIPCGNTDMEIAQDVSEWEDMYAEKYGDKFLKKNNDKDLLSE
jgi:Zn ribbon nucleic-acid-binding protein